MIFFLIHRWSILSVKCHDVIISPKPKVTCCNNLLFNAEKKSPEKHQILTFGKLFNILAWKMFVYVVSITLLSIFLKTWPHEPQCFTLTPRLWMASFSNFTTSSPSTPEQLKPLVQRIRMLCADRNVVKESVNYLLKAPTEQEDFKCRRTPLKQSQSSCLNKLLWECQRCVCVCVCETLSISFCSQGKEKVKPRGRVWPFRSWETRKSPRQAAMWSNSWTEEDGDRQMFDCHILKYKCR